VVREEGCNMLRCLHLLITSSTLPRYLLNTINYTYLNPTNADMDLYCAMLCRCVALRSESDDKSPHYLTLLYSTLLYSTLLYSTHPFYSHRTAGQIPPHRQLLDTSATETARTRKHDWPVPPPSLM
jgi:hypothetical protein